MPIKGDIWGDLAPLRGTDWGAKIRTVSAEVIGDAVRGLGTPLMQQIGTPPEGSIRKLPNAKRVCRNKGACASETYKCALGHPKLPDCFEAVGSEDPTITEAATIVALAWRDGKYVILIEGDEFV